MAEDIQTEICEAKCNQVNVMIVVFTGCLRNNLPCFFFLLLLKAMCNYVLILIISCLTLQMEDMGKNQQPGREQGQRSVEPSQDKGGVDTTTS